MTAELSVPVSSAQTVTRTTMNVTAAYNAAGDLLGFTSATERLEIINLRSTQYPVQYRIGSGDWQDIKEGKTAVIGIDLSAQTVRLRRSLYAGPVMVVDLVMYSKPTGLVAGDSETDPSAVSGAGVPSAFTSRALTDADDTDVLICASSQTATVNTGLRSGFGCSFKGAISFNGTATVTDVRTTGAANPWCALMQTGTDTYDVVGGKA